MASSWQKRNKAARAKGYRNYYDYRVHQYGKRPPGEPVEKRPRESGQRSAAALRRALKKPEQIALIIEVPVQHDATGQWTRVNYITTFTDGRIVEYSLPVDLEGYDDIDAWLDYWHDQFDDAEIDFLEYTSSASGSKAA